MPREIAQHIVLLQLKASNIDLARFPLEIKQSCKDPKNLAQCIDRLIESCGYNLATELFKHFFPHERSICDIKNSDGNTALHYAAREGYTETAKILLDTAGHNAWTFLRMKDDIGETALHKAAYRGSMEVVKLLLDTACNNTWTLLTMKDTNGWTALHFAAHYDLTEIVKLLLYAAGDKVQDYTAMETDEGQTASYLTFRASLKNFSANLKKINDNVACLIS